MDQRTNAALCVVGTEHSRSTEEDHVNHSRQSGSRHGEGGRGLGGAPRAPDPINNRQDGHGL